MKYTQKILMWSLAASTAATWIAGISFAAESTSFRLETAFPGEATESTGESTNFSTENAGITWRTLPIQSNSFSIKDSRGETAGAVDDDDSAPADTEDGDGESEQRGGRRGSGEQPPASPPAPSPAEPQHEGPAAPDGPTSGSRTETAEQESLQFGNVGNAGSIPIRIGFPVRIESRSTVTLERNRPAPSVGTPSGARPPVGQPAPSIGQSENALTAAQTAKSAPVGKPFASAQAPLGYLTAAQGLVLGRLAMVGRWAALYESIPAFQTGAAAAAGFESTALPVASVFSFWRRRKKPGRTEDAIG